MTNNRIEKYVTRKTVLIAEVSDAITLIFEKLERDLMASWETNITEMGKRIMAYSVTSPPLLEGMEGVPGGPTKNEADDLRRTFVNYTHHIQLEGFQYSGNGFDLEDNQFEIRFAERGLKQELAKEMDLHLNGPIVVTWQYGRGNHEADVHVPMLVNLEMDDLERFVSIFRRTWVDAVTWAKMQ